MNITELTGLPSDPDCLHCVLPAQIAAFVNAHPLKPAQHVLLEIAQVLGEFAGSAAYNNSMPVETILAFVNRQVEDTARRLLAAKQQSGTAPVRRQ